MLRSHPACKTSARLQMSSSIPVLTTTELRLWLPPGSTSSLPPRGKDASLQENKSPMSSQMKSKEDREKNPKCAREECQFSLGDPIFIGYVVQTTYFPGYSLKLCFSYWVIVWIFSGHCPTTQKPSFSSQDFKNNLSQGKINSDKYPHLPAVWSFSHSMALP